MSPDEDTAAAPDGDTVLAKRLRGVLTERKVSVRELSRRLPGDPESERRLLHKYLAGDIETMEPESSAEVVAALGGDVPSDYFVIPTVASAEFRRTLERRLSEVEARLEDLARRFEEQGE